MSNFQLSTSSDTKKNEVKYYGTNLFKEFLARSNRIKIKGTFSKLNQSEKKIVKSEDFD